jgi:hypothetical protein
MKWVSRSRSIHKAGKFFGQPSVCDSRLLVIDVTGENIPRQSLFFSNFFMEEKKIVLVRGKESRGKGSKRDEKGQKFFFNFFSPHVQ